MLGVVRDFVRQHAGQLGLAARREQQPVIDEDESAGHRERVDRGILHQEELEAAGAVRSL